MKIQTIEYFVALSESRTISEASRRLHVAQPSLSKSLQQMEEELELQLFIRSARGIRLTEPGEKVLRDARQILNCYNSWKEMGRENSLEQVDLYVHLSFPDFLFPEIVLNLQKKYPDVLINTHISNAPESYLSHSVSHPVIALVIHRDLASLEQLQGNPSLILMRGEYRCLVNARHSLAKQKSVTLKELGNYYLVLPNLQDGPDHAASQDAVLASILKCLPQGRRIRAQTVSNVLSLINQDDESYGLSFYPAANRYPLVASKQLVGIPIEEESTHGSLALFFFSNAYERHLLVRELVDATQAAAQEFLERHR